MKNITELKINQSQIQLLAYNIRKLLQDNDVTENDVAKALNLPVMTVRRIVSGETIDPRLSTLKLIADYFHVSIDALINLDVVNVKRGNKKNVNRHVPILEWQMIESIKSINQIDLTACTRWQHISLGNDEMLSDNTFALESRHSMQPRFPKGTLFIIDPNEKPIDGDIVVVKIKANSGLSLRELSIDSPKWQLQPLVIGSEMIFFSVEEHEIIGVVVLTLLYSR